jgi:hypothetical protein
VFSILYSSFQNETALIIFRITIIPIFLINMYWFFWPCDDPEEVLKKYVGGIKGKLDTYFHKVVSSLVLGYFIVFFILSFYPGYLSSTLAICGGVALCYYLWYWLINLMCIKRQINFHMVHFCLFFVFVGLLFLMVYESWDFSILVKPIESSESLKLSLQFWNSLLLFVFWYTCAWILWKKPERIEECAHPEHM